MRKPRASMKKGHGGRRGTSKDVQVRGFGFEEHKSDPSKRPWGRKHTEVLGHTYTRKSERPRTPTPPKSPEAKPVQTPPRDVAAFFAKQPKRTPKRTPTPTPKKKPEPKAPKRPAKKTTPVPAVGSPNVLANLLKDLERRKSALAKQTSPHQPGTTPKRAKSPALRGPRKLPYFSGLGQPSKAKPPRAPPSAPPRAPSPPKLGRLQML